MIERMSRIERVFLMNHVHVDPGFTDHVEALWHLFDDFLVRAMDLIEATADHPEPARFRHTCEVVSVVEHFLQHAAPAQIDRFLDHVRAGRIDIGAMWAHLTPIVDRRQMDWMMRRMQRLREDYGLRIVSAEESQMHTDGRGSRSARQGVFRRKLPITQSGSFEAARRGR